LLRFPKPDDVTVAVYGEDPQRLFELAWAYYDLGRERDGHVEVWEVVPSRRPAGARPESWSSAEDVWKGLPEGQSPFADAGQVWRLLAHPKHPDKCPGVDRHQILDPAAFFDAPREGVVGILLAVHGPGAFPRLEPERGLHLFVGNKSPIPCLVQT